jgi:DNA-binding transcriptional regulator LsrR (DeoR family)
VHFWNRRWTGISLEQYAACAQRSVAQQSPGVVVVAIGKNKAEAVHDAVARGLINNLLVDEELALAVDSLGVSDASR